MDDFNGALYTVKAFGYATAMVMAGALATVWGVKSHMGVQDVRILPIQPPVISKLTRK